MGNRTRKQEPKKDSRTLKMTSKRLKLGNKLKKIFKIDLDGFKVGLLFTDGFRGTVSLEHLFSKPKGLTAEILKGGFFERCFVESGALAWPNGFELCPDALRLWLTSQTHPSTKRAA